MSTTDPDRIAPQTMRVTVTVELDHHTLGRVRLSKENRSALARLPDMLAQAERLEGKSAGVVKAQLQALSSEAAQIPHAAD